MRLPDKGFRVWVDLEQVVIKVLKIIFQVNNRDHKTWVVPQSLCVETNGAAVNWRIMMWEGDS